jgi:predicted site-specific integrase-resolvase
LNLDARLTPSEAARLAGVSRQLFNWWRREGKVHPGEDGRYRAGDVLEAERDTRRSGRSHRRLPPPSAYRKVA